MNTPVRRHGPISTGDMKCHICWSWGATHWLNVGHVGISQFVQVCTPCYNEQGPPADIEVLTSTNTGKVS